MRKTSGQQMPVHPHQEETMSGTIDYTVTLPVATVEALEEEAEEIGMTVDDLLDSLINGYAQEKF
jgi:hypothetical protein